MLFDFTPHPGFNFLENFSEAFKIPLEGNKLYIPERMGKGSILKIDFSQDFKLLIHNYTFREEFILKRRALPAKSDLVSIVFYSSALPNNQLSNETQSITCSKLNNSAIEISSSDLNSEIRFPPGNEIYFTVVGIRKPVLSDLLSMNKPNVLLDGIMKLNSSFLFHENMWPEIEKLIKNLSLVNEYDPLSHFYFRNKVQDLLYLLFSKLVKRYCPTRQSMTNADIDHLYSVRSKILQDLSRPPRISVLARETGMSETKMKVLFKQVFGKSIYNYFQSARMEEAAFLLRQSDFTVSEVGYRLGFSNLSHFSRLFEKHYQTTPKKFSILG